MISARSNLQTQQLPNIANGRIAAQQHQHQQQRSSGGNRGKKIEEKKRRARYQTMIIDPLLLCSGSCTLIQSACTRMFRIDVIRQFRVKVGGRSRFSPMRIVLVSIPLLLAPIFFAPGGGNGKPSKYLRASIYPACQVERGDTEKRKREGDGKRVAGRGKVEAERERKSSSRKQFLRWCDFEKRLLEKWTGA